MFDWCRGYPLLLQVRLGQFGGAQAGNAEALRYDVVAEIPRIDFCSGSSCGHDVPFSNRGGSKACGRWANAVEQPLEADAQLIASKSETRLVGSGRQLYKETRGAGD